MTTEKYDLRVFVAGGSRGGKGQEYTKAAYELGKKIVKMRFGLDFGLSNIGIMGAVAQGVLDGCEEKKAQFPIAGITTPEYMKYYESAEILKKLDNLVVTQTLEERKQKLLEADFVVFAPGGVGTLDELAYDCVAMQDGLLDVKPFIFYNVNGFFHHLLEFLKHIAQEEFADPIPFIVVDDEVELGIAFRLLQLKYAQHLDKFDSYKHARQIMYELPYLVKQKKQGFSAKEQIIQMQNVSNFGDAEQRSNLAEEIEKAFVEKELSRLESRLAKSESNAKTIQEKINKFTEMNKND